MSMLAGINLSQFVKAEGYEPDRCVSRAEWVALMARSLGVLRGADKPGSGAAPGEPYDDAVNAVVRAGLGRGFPGVQDDPSLPITRAETAVLLIDMLAAAGVEAQAVERTDRAPDERAIPDWARDAAEKAWRLGFCGGETGGGFRPHDPLTLEEAAAALFRLLRGIGAVD
ncbi:S-layer homology domain-containing protein [Paenibacillus sp. UNC496MF]|nr:S-layer homology domain-containing protein [Paenibacillus sp. UNC496MF]